MRIDNEELLKRIEALEQKAGIQQGVADPQTGYKRSTLVPPSPTSYLPSEKIEDNELLDKIQEMIDEAFDKLTIEPSDVYPLIQQFLNNPNNLNIINNVSTTGLESKVFAVQHAATAGGDGLYDCYEQKFDKDDWRSTDGTAKVENLNTTEVEVLNLAEFDPEAVYVAHLAANDLILAWKKKDDEKFNRWIGIPFRQANADRPRIAYVASVSGTTATCQLDTENTGTEIAVTCFICGGSDLAAAVPRLADGSKIMVTKIGGTWYCLTTFNASQECD